MDLPLKQSVIDNDQFSGGSWIRGRNEHVDTQNPEEDAMNAIQFLKNEHEKAKQAFGDIQAASGGQRAELWATLEPELKTHEEIEEVALYGPVAQEVGAKDQTLKEWQDHHHEEFIEAEALIEEISLEHHIQEEEGNIWPRIERAWDRSKLEHAGQQMEILKREKISRVA